ncbi:hypothetical protein HDV00_000542 [Rhizophlyctis rosea]|nr:hypothetical protein HDV00_000542 [Rhizophlyctis rosea]
MSQSNIPLRKLGKYGPLVPALGLGCMGMAGAYGAADKDESIAVLNHALDLGVVFWDTADRYGDNEDLLAEVLKTRRDEVFICTKFGGIMTPDGKFGVCGTPEYVKQACEKSLKRLGVDVIDLYYQHRVDPETPIEDTVRAMAELVKEGKVRYLGMSECSAATLRRACAVHHIAAVQVEYSPWTLDIETNDLLSTCRKLGVAIVAYSPLGRGFMTGQFKKPEDIPANDARHLNPRFQGENFFANLKLVDKFEEVAKRKGCKPSQLVLSWVLNQGEDFFAIPGTKRSKYLEENVASCHVTITEEDDKEIRDILRSVEVVGTRYPEHFMKTVHL